MAELTRIGLKPTQWLACGIIGTLASLLVGTAWFAFPHLMVSWEGSTYDARLRWRGPEQTTPHLVLIGRDQRSDAQLGLGIWDRAILARVVQALSEVGAAVVAADFYFTETSPPERGGAASDAALVAATKVAGNVIYPLPLILGQPDTPSKINDSDSSLDSLLFFSGSPPLNLESVRHLYPVTTMELPLPALAKAAISVGHIAASSDSDGVYRAVPAFVNLGGRPFPAFGVTIAAVFLQIPPDQIVIEPGRSLKFLGAHPLPRRTDGASQALSLPIDASGRLLVNYAGRWVDSPFPYFSFVDVWDAIEEGRLAELRQQVQGKIVLLLHAGVESDKRQTPLDTVAPGGFIHAN